MTAGYQDQFLEQGTTFVTTLDLSDENGIPYDLTGFTVKSQARSSYTSKKIVIDFDTTIPEPYVGVVELRANSAVTANVKTRKLVYDVVLLENSTGDITKILEGQLIVSPSVTRP